MSRLSAFFIIGLLVLAANGAPQFYQYDYAPISRSTSQNSFPFGIFNNPFQAFQQPQIAPEGRFFPIMISLARLNTRMTAIEDDIEELTTKLAAATTTTAK